MKRRTALGLLSSLVIPSAADASSPNPSAAALGSCLQLLRVESAGWGSVTATLTLWLRDAVNAPLRRDGRGIPVILGRGGLRWGRGGHPIPRGAALKREGDGCSPAGIFELDHAFGAGTAQETGVTRWPWVQMTPAHAGVDDSRSRHYNRIVDATRVKKDWASAENMVPGSGVYRLGLVVRHNWQQRPQGGSCIFLHIRQGAGVPTSGCTAMTERAMKRVLTWLDAAKHPRLVQLPRAEWQTCGPAWHLPV